MSALRDALALVVVDYFDRSLFLTDEHEMRTSRQLVDDLEAAALKAVGDLPAQQMQLHVVALAREVAKAAPKKRGAYVHSAGIPWDLIGLLRTALDVLDKAVA